MISIEKTRELMILFATLAVLIVSSHEKSNHPVDSNQGVITFSPNKSRHILW
ncbi:hypothetical protein GCM10011409_43680 [Lentibacillus populi]|uniref:Uncharacterized protein n=1 Tax=Lentibacillus populi TaxID=1827502 RepID=A0A9W5U286_9BACI|nr:hypothetical protein GCM10011409_43680 [Lentibacillus populi]